MFFFQPPVLWNVSTVFKVSHSCMKTYQTLAGEKPASLYGLLCRGVKRSQFASEMSCQALETCRWLNLSPCFDIAETQRIGKALVKNYVLGSGVAAINYVAQVLTPITLCCHSLGEMTLMSLSHECNCRMSFTLHSNPRKKNGLTCLIKL